MVRSKTKAERIHMDKVANLGCLVCRKEGNLYSPAELHHIRDVTLTGLGQRAKHTEIIPLCVAHHRRNNMVIVKKDGRLQDFDSTKLIKSIGAKYKAVQSINIIGQIEKELSTTRFREFYPNTDNIQDLVEKYVLQAKTRQKQD